MKCVSSRKTSLFSKGSNSYTTDYKHQGKIIHMLTSRFHKGIVCLTRGYWMSFYKWTYLQIVSFGSGGYDMTRSCDCYRWFVCTGLCDMCRTMCFGRWRADACMRIGSFCRMWAWYIGWCDLSMTGGCIMCYWLCHIGCVGDFLEMSTVSAKNLSWWCLYHVGTWFSAGLSNGRWSPSSRLLVLYSYSLSCA